MSRRTVLTLVLALSAFGLTAGLTASLGVSTDQLGAGSSPVTSCDPVETGGVHVAYDVTAGTNVVTAVTLSDIAAACDGQTATITLLDTNGADLDRTTGTITLGGTTVESFTLVDQDADAASVKSVSVVIAGAGI